MQLAPSICCQPAFHERLEIARRLLPPFGRDQVGDVLADQFFPRHAMQPASRRIDVQHGPVEVLNKNRVGRAFEQLAKPLLAVAQRLLRPNPLQRAPAVVGQRLQGVESPPGRKP